MREMLGDALVTMLGLFFKDPLLVLMHLLLEMQILG